MKYIILLIGSGGREHSIIWKLNQDKNVRKIFCIGENYAISKVCETKEMQPYIKKLDEHKGFREYLDEKDYKYEEILGESYFNLQYLRKLANELIEDNENNQDN